MRAASRGGVGARARRAPRVGRSRASASDPSEGARDAGTPPPRRLRPARALRRVRHDLGRRSTQAAGALALRHRPRPPPEGTRRARASRAPHRRALGSARRAHPGEARGDVLPEGTRPRGRAAPAAGPRAAPRLSRRPLQPRGALPERSALRRVHRGVAAPLRRPDLPRAVDRAHDAGLVRVQIRPRRRGAAPARALARLRRRVLADAPESRHPRSGRGQSRAGRGAPGAGPGAASGAECRGRGQLPPGRALRSAGRAGPGRRTPGGGGPEVAERPMGKEVRGKPEAPALSADPERSIGAYLARQRELRGISVEELAALTRIPRRSLERLESGVFDRAPDGFVRGFVRTVAAALGLDPDETVMRLLSEPPAEGAAARGDVAAWARPTARWAALALVGVLAAAALGWLVSSLRARPSAPPEDEVVLRPDPIRALAREAAGRAQEVEQASPARETASNPPAMPAEPTASDEVAREAAGEHEELPVAAEPEVPPTAAASPASDPGAAPEEAPQGAPVEVPAHNQGDVPEPTAPAHDPGDHPEPTTR